MKAGEIITERNMRAIRPGLGVSPKYYEKFLGKTVKNDVSRGIPVSFELIN